MGRKFNINEASEGWEAIIEEVTDDEFATGNQVEWPEHWRLTFGKEVSHWDSASNALRHLRSETFTSPANNRA